MELVVLLLLVDPQYLPICSAIVVEFMRCGSLFLFQLCVQQIKLDNWWN
jgi:hypothetical protein